MPTKKETERNALYSQFGLKQNPLAGGLGKATGRGLKELAKKRKKRKKVAAPPRKPTGTGSSTGSGSSTSTGKRAPRQRLGRRLINHLFPGVD